MRYALIFAGVAAAYDAYGYNGYGEEKPSSSTPAVHYTSSVPAYGGYGNEHKTSSAPVPSKSSASSKLGYTTIYPGYGKQPVTVTSQYQPYPTCGAAGSDGKSCNHWKEDKYVSTVLNDYDHKKVTVTDVEKAITCFHTKTTITHYPTASVPAGHGGYGGNAYPTGSYGSDHKNSTKPWYELYEKVHEIKYKELGAHGLPGYGGSGLCKSCDDEQPYKVKEYKDGKWNEYETTAIYKAPTPDVKTYEKPGVYTEPAKDMTVTQTITKPYEATTTAKAGHPVTYGGVTTDFKETGVKTCAYGAYETGKDSHGNDVTSTVVKTITVTVSTTGKYEVAKPTTTVYDHDTDVVYPTISVYQPGVYHKDAQTVTVTKAGQTAKCEYKQTKTYPAGPKKTPTHGDEYPHGSMSSSKPSVESKTEYKPGYPASTPVYGEHKSSSTPCSSSSSKPVVGSSTKSEHYPTSTPVYGNEYPHGSSSYPSVETKTSSAPYYPEYPASSSTPVYGEHKSSSTPCSSSSSKPVVGSSTKSEHYPTSTPVYGNEYPHGSSSYPSVETKTSSAPYYPEYPASSSTPVYEEHKSSSTPCSSSTVPVYDHKSSGYPEVPVASSTAPAYNSYPTPTPANYEDYSKFSYHPTPSKVSGAYPEPSVAYPQYGMDYEAESGYGA